MPIAPSKYYRDAAMSRAKLLVLMCVLLGACTRVVTETTSELRASRYAALEFTRAVSPDSVIAYAQRVLAAENVKLQAVDRKAGTIKAGPVAFAATAEQPALEADLNINTQVAGAATRVRIYATSLVERGQSGGQDARLAAFVQRIRERLEALIGH